MSARLVMVKPGGTVQEAVRLMVANNISGLIVEEGGKAVGIVTMKGIFKKVLAVDGDTRKTKVGDIMSKPVLSVNPLSKVEKAAELMTEHHVKRLAVVDGSNRVVGIVTAMDIVSNLPELIDVMFRTWVKPQWR